MSVDHRKPRIVGYGDAPTVSPDGTRLAYLSNAHDARVIIRDLLTGQQRSVHVRALIGAEGNLENGASIAWLADSRTVLVVPGEQIRLDSSGTNGASESSDATTEPDMIEVRPAADGHLSAVGISVVGLGAAARDNSYSLMSDASRPNSVLAETFNDDTAVIDEINIGDDRAVARRLLSISHALIQAIDPTGTRILYLQGHTPPALWTATIRGHQLTDRRRLYHRSPIGNAAW